MKKHIDSSDLIVFFGWCLGVVVFVTCFVFGILKADNLALDLATFLYLCFLVLVSSIATFIAGWLYSQIGITLVAIYGFFSLFFSLINTKSR